MTSSRTWKRMLALNRSEITMTIFFLCGDLEPGMDGIGDYTRTLAAELIQQGHKAFAAALSDHHVSHQTCEQQVAGATIVNVLRLPRSSSLSRRMEELSKKIKELDPDWLSLQYGPFTFDARGLPFTLGSQLSGLGTSRNWHIMFHELWVGSDTFNIKTACLAYLQKMIIRKMLHRIRPGVIHSQLPVNQQKLQKLGYPVKYLPLFSNVPVSSLHVPQRPHKIFRIGFFSQVESSECIIEFLDRFEKHLAEKGDRVEILLMSGRETNTRSFINTMEKSGRFRNAIKCTGFLKAEALSKEIKSCQLGVTPVPRHALGKSGSVAAFLTHGIPVAAPNVSVGFDPFQIGFDSASLRSSILVEPHMQGYLAATKNVKAAHYEIDLPVIAKRFANDLCA